MVFLAAAGVLLLAAGTLAFRFWSISDVEESGAGAVGEQAGTSDIPAYLMSFHACDTAVSDCTRPQNHETYVAGSDDGLEWSLLAGLEPFRGSVPDIVVRDGILYVYTAESGGTVTRFDIARQEVLSSDRVTVEGVVGFVDPAPIIDDDGNVVLFFLHCRSGEESTNCFGSQPGAVMDAEPTRLIGSAVEIDGSDGTRFALADGDRLTTVRGTDPDVYRDGSNYVLYVSEGGSFYAYESGTLHGTYQSSDTSHGGLFTRSGGVPSGYYDQGTGTYHSFVHTADQTGVAVIRETEHGDLSGVFSDSEWKTVLTPEDIGMPSTVTLESPGILSTGNGL